MERSKQLNNRTYKFSNESDNRALPSVASLSCSASLYASSPPRGLWREKVASAIEKNDNERGKVLTKHATEAVCVLYRESSLLTLPLAAEWVNFPDASLTISRRVDEKHHMSLSSRRGLGAPPSRQAVVALYRPSYMSTSFTSSVLWAQSREIWTFMCITQCHRFLFHPLRCNTQSTSCPCLDHLSFVWKRTFSDSVLMPATEMLP